MCSSEFLCLASLIDFFSSLLLPDPLRALSRGLFVHPLGALAHGALQPHYMKGGPMGLQFDPLRLGATKDAVALRKRQNRELNNGRLAMIGILSFYAALEIPGSVPALSNVHYL